MKFLPPSRSQKKVLATAAVGAAGLATFLAFRNYRWRRANRFSGAVVAVTGGSRGLGLELARRWAREGARIAICARSTADLRRAAQELRGAGADVFAATCDVGNQRQAQNWIEAIHARWGTLDVLVNNAGIIQAGPLDCMTLNDYARAMATHFWGPLYLIEAALPFLRLSRGRIVNIASIGGEISVPHLTPYCASKFALSGLSQGLSTSLREAGISVTTVYPGLMRTGSPRNAEFKGNHRAEYAWFSISDSLPGITVSSRRAASQILEACRRGQGTLRISAPAKIAVPLTALLPNLTASVLGLVNRALPHARAQQKEARRGDQSFSPWSPSILTALTERAAARNNQIRPR